MRSPSSDWIVSLFKCAIKKDPAAHFAQYLIYIQVMLARYTICKLVELVDEVPDVDAAHRVRLRERHRLRETLPGSLACLNRNRDESAALSLHCQLLLLAKGQPADTCDLVELFRIVHHHRLVVVVHDDLRYQLTDR